MEQYTRRIIGIATHSGQLDGLSICKMFNALISSQTLPIYLSSDHDPLFMYHRWIANLEILGIEQIIFIPYTPISHPFIERLIGTIRREYLDHVLFVNDQDLQQMLQHFVYYYNQHRAHYALESQTPLQKANLRKKQTISINSHRWKSQLKGLAQLPIAA